jgi:hypothetical protein
MSAPAETRSAVLRFLDAFFQERNIKWMLGIGILILLGSSLMLVTAHWDDYTPLWKYLILLGYTAGIHGLGQISYHSLALQRTGTGLMALTVLLIPLTFLGLHWVHPDFLASWSAVAGQIGLVALLAGNVAFSTLAARRIFGHFLRRTQPTFVTSYLLLAVAGAVVPALPDGLAPFASLLLWGVFAVGAVKVNRHVFWLAEEHRLPRICGFFPILLLGGMFLGLFAVSLAPDVPVTWIGCGLVMTAIPVLLSADALAHVFQQRNMPLPRPLPWSIVLPMFIGLAMTLAGVWMSGIDFPKTHTLPLTAVLAAAVMMVTARRTGRAAFVWLMLGAVLLAYQTSPVFFQQVARVVVRQSATAVHESRLPYAFYGLTYLPLLAGLSGIAALLHRHDERLFSVPARQFSVGLGMALLLNSVTHPKALFPVGLALIMLFAWQAVLFRDRRLVLAGIGALLVSAVGVEAFAQQVLLMPHTVELPLLAWALAGGLLLWPGGVIDRRISAWQLPRDMNHAAPLCRRASLVVLFFTAAAWLFAATWSGRVAMIAGVLCGVLLLVRAWQLTNRLVAQVAISYAVLLVAVLAVDGAWSASAVMGLESLLLLGLWAFGRNARGAGRAAAAVDDSRQTRQISSLQTLRLAGADVALAGLGCFAVLYVLPLMLATMLTGVHFSGWVTGTATLMWAIDAAWRRRSPFLTLASWLLAIGAIGVPSAALFGWSTVYDWYPALASVLPLCALGLVPRGGAGKARPGEPQRVWEVLRLSTLATLAIVAVGSIAVFTVPMRVAGAAALIGLVYSALRWQHPALRTAALSVAGWQGLAAALQLASPGLHALDDLPFPVPPSMALPVALAAALLSIVWNTGSMQRIVLDRWRAVQCTAFRIVTIAGLLSPLLLRGQGLSLWEAIAATAVFTVLAIEQIWTARRVAEAQADETRSVVRRRDEGESHVWLALGLSAVGVGYLLLMRVIPLGTTIGLFAPLVIGVALWSLAHICRPSAVWNVAHRPLLRTGMALPLASVAIGLMRHASVPEPTWLGINSLALLLAAGFYFWRGLEKRTPGLLIGSALILNLASALLWRELTFWDPQFFMIPLGLSIIGLVELLKPQIEARYVNPLRYIGALTILVSPTFHIVEGSWLHLLTLMIASVLITLMAIGLRVRALMYTGTAFLTADIVAMVVRGSIDNTSLLWIAGILVGGAVIALAACCEHHREQMLQRVRMLATELATWE